MNSFKKMRTAVIGIGSMGQNHARIYSEISDLRGVIDFDPKQGKIIAKKYGTRYYSDFSEINEKIDAVSIVVPTKYHLEVFKKLIDKDINLLVEKPLALNHDESIQMVNLSVKSKVKVSVGHIERHNQVIDYVKNGLRDGKWGKLLNITARRFSLYPNRIIDVGVIFDLSVHDLDIISYLVDSPVDTLYCNDNCLSNDRNNEENVNIMLSFKNGVTAVSQTSWLYPYKKRDLSILTSNYFIEVDYMNQTIFMHSKDDHNSLATEEIKLEPKEPLFSELEDFLSSIIEDRDPKTTVIEGAYAVKLAEACKASLLSKKVINFNL